MSNFHELELLFNSKINKLTVSRFSAIADLNEEREDVRNVYTVRLTTDCNHSTQILNITYSPCAQEILIQLPTKNVVV